MSFTSQNFPVHGDVCYSVPVDDIPVYTIGMVPGLKLGFDIPLYPQLLTEVPVPFDSYVAMMHDFNDLILTKFPTHTMHRAAMVRARLVAKECMIPNIIKFTLTQGPHLTLIICSFVKGYLPCEIFLT